MILPTYGQGYLYLSFSLSFFFPFSYAITMNFVTKLCNPQGIYRQLFDMYMDTLKVDFLD